MDHNLAFSCVGYGSVRVLRERCFSVAPFTLPAAWILKKKDPVQFCVDALGKHHPELLLEINDETRQAIVDRLKSEAKRDIIKDKLQ